MAYWLDPAHQPMPIQIQQSIANSGQVPWREEYVPVGDFLGAPVVPKAKSLKLRPGNGYGPLNLKLPAGIETLASIDPKNEILVRGTAAGIEQLRALVAQLDVPISQIEVEAQIVDMSPARLASLPLVFCDAAQEEEKIPILGDVKVGNGGAKVGDGDIFTRTAFAAPTSDASILTQKLNEGLADGSARIINNPRITVMNGLTASLYSTEQRALLLDTPPTTEVGDEAINDEANAAIPTKEDVNEWREGLTFVQSQTGFVAAPVLHGDVMNLGFRITFNNSVTSGNTIMRDGQTLAVRLPNDNIENGWPRVALIKAHIIHRAGEDENKIIKFGQ